MSPLPPLPPVYKKILLFTVLFFIITIPVIYFIISVRGARVVDVLSSENPSGTNTPVASTEKIIEYPDSVRVTHLKLIKEKIADALRRKVDIPLPENALEVTFGEKKMGYQGVAGKTLFDTIGLDFPRDPVTNEMYYYYFNPETQEYQVLAFMDSEKQSNTTINKRPAYTLGSTDGNFLLTGAGDLAVSVLKTAQKIDTSSVVSRKLLGLSAFQSCKDIKDFSTEFKSGKYTIEIKGKEREVFCDMETDGGGWTLFYANNEHADSLIQMSYIQMREALSNQPIDELSDYANPNLAGLLDYSHFIGLGSKEILVRNRTGDGKKWFKFVFSTSFALNWALGESILGVTEKGCYRLPRGSTWSLYNQSNIMNENLQELMNHRGTSWGVSHGVYLCNGFGKGVNSHMAFHNARLPANKERAKPISGLGGDAMIESENRYFIR